MSWTALVAEYLVIGLQCTAWLTLLFLRFCGLRPSTILHALNTQADHLSMTVTFAVLVISYSVGMLFDKLFHNITEPLLKNRVRRLWKELYKPSRPNSLGALFYTAEDYLFRPEGREARLYRRRGRVRVLRAALFNIPLLAIGVLLNVPAASRSWWIVTIMSVGLWVCAVVAFAAVHKEYVHMIARAARSMSGPSDMADAV